MAKKKATSPKETAPKVAKTPKAASKHLTRNLRIKGKFFAKGSEVTEAMESDFSDDISKYSE